MVLAPHCDDETIGCGGLIARVLREGGRATVAVLRDEGPVRWAEMDAAAGVYRRSGGVFHVERAVVPELQVTLSDWLNSYRTDLLVKIIEGFLERDRPELVVIPSPAETHQEHKAVYEAAMIAMRPSGGTDRWRPPRIVTFEHLADAWRRTTPVVPASWYVELKLPDIVIQGEAMAAHESQVRPPPSERSLEALQNLAKVRGAEAGVEWAEAFAVLRWLS
jgi:LmbE family N-acetylglucosaminyl deacetylase